MSPTMSALLSGMSSPLSSASSASSSSSLSPSPLFPPSPSSLSTSFPPTPNPDALSESDFWTTIESAWHPFDPTNLRHLLGAPNPHTHLEAYATALYFQHAMLHRLGASLVRLPVPHLAAWLAHLDSAVHLLALHLRDLPSLPSPKADAEENHTGQAVDFPNDASLDLAGRACFAVLAGRAYYVKLIHATGAYVIYGAEASELLDIAQALKGEEEDDRLRALEKVYGGWETLDDEGWSGNSGSGEDEDGDSGWSENSRDVDNGEEREDAWGTGLRLR